MVYRGDLHGEQVYKKGVFLEYELAVRHHSDASKNCQKGSGQ